MLADLVEHTSHNDVLIAGARSEDQRFHAAVLSNDINVELAGVFVVVFAQVRDGFRVAGVIRLCSANGLSAAGRGGLVDLD